MPNIDYLVYLSGGGYHRELLGGFDTADAAQEYVAREVGAPASWREDFPAELDGWRFGGMSYPEPDPRYLYIEHRVAYPVEPALRSSPRGRRESGAATAGRWTSFWRARGHGCPAARRPDGLMQTMCAQAASGNGPRARRPVRGEAVADGLERREPVRASGPIRSDTARTDIGFSVVVA